MSSEEPTLRAIALAKTGKHKQAREILRKVLQHDMDNLMAWVAMAQLMESRVQAIYCLQQVLRLRPNNPWATAHLRRLTADTRERAALAEAASEAMIEQPTAESLRDDDPFAVMTSFESADAFPFEMPSMDEGARATEGSFLDPLADIPSSEAARGLRVDRVAKRNRRLIIIGLLLGVVGCLVVVLGFSRQLLALLPGGAP